MLVKTSHRTKAEMEQESVVDGNLATEASLIVLDTLEIIVKVKSMNKKIPSNMMSLANCSQTVLCTYCSYLAVV